MSDEKGNTVELNYPTASSAFHNCEIDVFLSIDQMMMELGDKVPVKIIIIFQTEDSND